MDENKIPELTLTPEISLENIPALEQKEAAPIEKGDISLTPEEQAVVDSFAKKIDITDANLVLQYGAGAQKNIADFSQSALENVRTKDLGEVGSMITGLVTELRGFTDDEKKGGLLGFFTKQRNKIAAIKAKYDKAEVNVDRICQELEKHQVTLLKDIAILDKMYEMNLNYFKQLNMYIMAGRKKLDEVKNEVMPALEAKAKQSGLPEDAQAVNDMRNMLNRFEKKIHDLELTRVVSIQMAPQVRMVQNSDSLMVEKIQSTLVNTIPLWKSQMVLALGMANSREALESQRAVTNMTNELLRKNADALKLGTLETAKESERGIVDIETLKYTNQQIIDTLNEVLAIQQEGSAKRREAEAELGRIEGELKQKLLEINTGKGNVQ
ncbi:MAG: toxic anion resistance protein [Oscillospiraceae bacterium]|jgi:uncharacterized protein YaaN involved in tellurite resistance